MIRLGDDEFVGYLFRGAPERRHRLWVLDRHLEQLYGMAAWNVAAGDNRLGNWTANIPEIPQVGYVTLRYRHLNPDGSDIWTAVWKLTDTTIPQDPSDAWHGHGITTFGRDDDVWRLMVWPD